MKTTLKIKALYQRQKQLLHKRAEGGKKPDQKLLKSLETNRERILNEVRELRLKDDVIHAFSEELKKAVMTLDEIKQNSCMLSEGVISRR